jgi:predicted  nucleic acid-binding Zn-ribbon protein
MNNIVPALNENIAAVQAEIKRVRDKAKKDRAQPLRLEETTKELRGLNVRLNSLQQNLAAADTPKPVTNSGC